MGMKGVILAGGQGTRLAPATRVVNKHLLPIVNQPMIVHPLRVLTDMGCTDILIITGGGNVGGFADFLGDGAAYRCRLTYRVQPDAPSGVAAALACADGFVGSSRFAVILGDQVFDRFAVLAPAGGEGDACLYLASVSDAQRFGVARFDGDRLAELVEKPTDPPSRYAVTGLYVYPPEAIDIAKNLTPSARGEVEITDVNNFFISKGRCATVLHRGFWCDAGTPESLARSTAWAASMGADYWTEPLRSA